jgi:hypothetical protein
MWTSPSSGNFVQEILILLHIYVPSVGRSGGIITVWDSSVFSGAEVFHNMCALIVEFHATKSDDYWTLTNIYAHCTDNEQLQFLQWMHNIHIPLDENYMMVGDFNLIRSSKIETGLVVTSMECFCSMRLLVILAWLISLLKGESTLGTTCRTLPLLQRLDWFFSSLAWTETFPIL